MNFFGVGAPELVLILIIAVIVVGPQRIPEVASQLAKAIRYLRGYATDATSQMRTEMDQLMKEYDEVRKELREFREVVGKDVSTMTDQVASVAKDMDQAAQEAQPMIEPSAEPPPAKRRPEGSAQS
jgi:sec-independent protein translocase protein TatB